MGFMHVWTRDDGPEKEYYCRYSAAIHKQPDLDSLDTVLEIERVGGETYTLERAHFQHEGSQYGCRRGGRVDGTEN